MLKICDVKNITEAKTLTFLGVDFLGFHLMTENDWKRKSIIKMALKYISEYSDSKAILITKEKDFKVLEKIINEFEFDGVQLHYKNNHEIISKIRTRFGQDFVIFDVKEASENDLFVHPRADYLLLDSSYIGGTGQKSSHSFLNKIVNEVDLSKTFIAGGIKPENISKFIDLGFINFDIQSGVKEIPKSENYNIEYNKVNEVLTVLNKEPMLSCEGHLYLSVKSKEEFYEYYNLVDALHFDISDGFVSDVTDIDSLSILLKEINTFNSMIPIQLHFFVKSTISLMEILERLNIDLHRYPYLVFVHVNKDNYKSISKHEFSSAVDISDILNDDFPLELFITKRLIVCLQNESNDKRIVNLNRALKYIRLSNDDIQEIIIDRGVDDTVILRVDSASRLSLIAGRYLKNGDIQNKINLLKGLLNAKR